MKRECRAHQRFLAARTPSSIHPQGWVPIETVLAAQGAACCVFMRVAFTPKGGCPLKRSAPFYDNAHDLLVAFTPKGGCPLKLFWFQARDELAAFVAFTPKGGCPLKPYTPRTYAHARKVAFTPKGGCPLKRVGVSP